MASAMTFAPRKKFRSAISEQPQQTHHELYTAQYPATQRAFQARKPLLAHTAKQRDPFAIMGPLIPRLLELGSR